MKGPKNFGNTQTVFHKDDVPTKRRERKKDVNEVSALLLLYCRRRRLDRLTWA